MSVLAQPINRMKLVVLVQVDNLFRQNERVSDFTLLDVGFVTIHAPKDKLSGFFQAGKLAGQTIYSAI